MFLALVFSSKLDSSFVIFKQKNNVPKPNKLQFQWNLISCSKYIFKGYKVPLKGFNLDANDKNMNPQSGEIHYLVDFNVVPTRNNI